MSGYYLLKNGEYAYNKSYSVGYDFGSIKRLERYPMGALSTLYICFALKKYNSDYIKTYFDSLKWYKEIYMISAEGARNHGLLNVPTDDFFDTYHYITEDNGEQFKIAKIMELLEQKIQKQQELVECLKKYKRGAIKSLFTQEISLAGNMPKWEKHKMGDLITLQSGQDFAPSDYNDQGEGTPYMTGASCIVDGKTMVSRWTTVPRCFAYRGDTLLVCKGSGSGAVVMLSQDQVHIARQFMALRPHENMTKEFCFYLTLHLSEKMKQSATGLIEGIDRKTVLDQDVLLPSITEQEQIVEFLSAIEKTLLTHEGILKKLVSTRKGLMQQLFI